MGSISVEFVVERERRNIREQRGKVEMVRAGEEETGQKEDGDLLYWKKKKTSPENKESRGIP